jgi:hypothetical protein
MAGDEKLPGVDCEAILDGFRLVNKALINGNMKRAPKHTQITNQPLKGPVKGPTEKNFFVLFMSIHS